MGKSSLPYFLANLFVQMDPEPLKSREALSEMLGIAANAAGKAESGQQRGIGRSPLSLHRVWGPLLAV